MTDGGTLLDVRRLSVSYGRGVAAKRAVHDVDLALAPGRRYGVVGETGCGKTSVLKALLGLIRPPHRVEADAIELDGVGDLSRLGGRRLRQVRGARIGYVAQNPFGALHPVLGVGAQFHRFLVAHDATSGRAETRRRATDRLAELGIPDPERIYDTHAGTLSGGMAQRVVIAFATLLNPSLVVADEPTTALDVTVQRQVLDLIAAPGVPRTLLMTTHDLSVVAQYCDDVFVMYAGRIVEAGTVAEVFVDPQHPYTAALLASVPRPGTALTILPGAPPALGEHGPGCDFADRCTRRSDRCAERPALLGAGPVVACHHPVPATSLADGRLAR
jgi:oligopeptide/dipeptide ABC transporter ATP-binding protein